MPGVMWECSCDLSSWRKIWNILIKWIRKVGHKSNLFPSDRSFNLLPGLLTKAFSWRKPTSTKGDIEERENRHREVRAVERHPWIEAAQVLIVSSFPGALFPFFFSNSGSMVEAGEPRAGRKSLWLDNLSGKKGYWTKQQSQYNN